MTLLTLENVVRTFGDVPCLEEVGLQVDAGDRIGIVGDNGAGKTTLARIIAGIDPPDHGERRARRDLRVAYGAQIPDLPEELSLREAARMAVGELDRLEQRQRALELRIADDPENRALHDEYDAVHAAFQAAGGYERDRLLAQALDVLGLRQIDPERPVGALSGGQRSRLMLATLMLAPAELLILDEPTNHLDLDGIDFVEELVLKRPGAVIVISHDRRFLDRVTNAIVDVDGGKVSRYRGNYTAYKAQKELQLKTALRDYKKQQDFIEKEMEFIRRHMGSRRTAEAKGRLKRLNRLQRMSRPQVSRRSLKLRLAHQGGYAGQVLLHTDGIGFSYPDHPVFDQVKLELRRGEVLGIVGDNGTGKTTLLNLLAGRALPTRGELRRPVRAQPGYFGQEIEPLPEDTTVLRAVHELQPTRAEGEIRDLLALFMFYADEVEQQVSTLSGGERRRLSLARLMLAGFDYLLLDEPTNHLDIATCEGLEAALAGYQGAVACVSHDRQFLSSVADRILYLSEGRSFAFDGGFEEFVAFRTRRNAERREAERAARQQERAKEQTASASTAQDKPPQRPGKIRNAMEFERLEASIFDKEEELNAARAAMGEPDAWKEPDRLRQLQDTERRLQQELAALYERWENWQ